MINIMERECSLQHSLFDCKSPASETYACKDYFNVVKSLSGKQLYFTSDGFKRAFPSDRATVVEIYLNENIDRHEFSEKLTGLYGGSVEDAIGEDISADNYEDRTQRVAEEKMAQLMSLYGVTDVDYSIKIGDDIISGNSEKFIIRDISSLHDLAEGQLGPVAVAMKAVSAVIVNVPTASA